CFCDEEDSGLSDEEQERKGPKNRPKHTRKRIHQAKKTFWRNSKQLLKIKNVCQAKFARILYAKSFILHL
ncbi:hypothetical protein, partial [Bacteroides sp. An279]